MKENKTIANEMIEKLTRLEYAIRSSMTVREDQEDNADPRHLEEAALYDITISAGMTKGDLLGVVQTMVRAKRGER